MFLFITGLILTVVFFIYVLGNKKRIVNKFRNKIKIMKQGGNGLGVDMIYCISMPDRIEHAKKKMKEIGGNYKLIDAVKPTDLSPIDYCTASLTYFTGAHMFAKRTKLPVALSFYMCYNDALENGYETICIFEDDVIFPKGVSAIKKAVNEFKHTDFEVFYMGYFGLTCNNYYQRISEGLVDVTERALVGNHGLCMKLTFLEKYLASPFLFYATFNDVTLNKFCIINGIKVCVPNEALVDQDRKKFGTNNDSFAMDIPTCNFNDNV